MKTINIVGESVEIKYIIIIFSLLAMVVYCGGVQQAFIIMLWSIILLIFKSINIFKPLFSDRAHGINMLNFYSFILISCTFIISMFICALIFGDLS